ncbi:ABC transporter substrate-binding protein [Propionimicrobium sp. PCR01-08-3]|uniref:ABC transporter substrate-binding protein n=1 Tax=Propionimicrobium sp. PCR01-08-3 TaxID=3052086 RepID=UPI00255C31B0|nr:ABC transporter substrate-binding protein [Propionimicrobium sp. PCR01-08-3]WIY83660.1 ABC transporter substrate-binding protein [Propionimicrobium sp. PCR01-08-3]
MRRIAALGIVATLALTACGGGGSTTEGSASAENNDLSYDVSSIQKVDDIAALLPEDVASSGKLTIGAAIDYAPAEFRAEDLQTAIGYDVDLGKALGKVLGVETEVSAAEFANLMPGIGSTYNIGISSFTVTPERTENYNMISYIMVGSSYAVQKGNPQGFDPNDVCGASIGVQTGTYQEEVLATMSTDCTAAGKEAIDVLSYGVQSDVTTNLIGGKVEAFFADSTVADYSVKLTNDQLEVTGGIQDAAPQGIVVSKDDEQLTEAMQQAMQQLMDDGTWQAILANWGVTEDAALTTAELNPEA